MPHQTSSKIVALLALLSLSACSGAYSPDTYTYPTGYAHHDTTPISSPHGYKKTITEEMAIKAEIDGNAAAWRDGLAQVLMPIAPALDMNTPVAVRAVPALTPMNASAANYLRDLLIDMSYLTALEGETDQVVVIQAAQSAEKTTPTSADVTLQVWRGVNKLAEQAGKIATPYQDLPLLPRLPGLSHIPTQGPVEGADQRLWGHLNEQDPQ